LDLSLGINRNIKIERKYGIKIKYVCYVGRAAEVKLYGEDGIDGGASSDLQHASNYAYIAISELGMDERLPNITKSAWAEKMKSLTVKSKRYC